MAIMTSQKVALITGASRGIGAAYARALAAQGYSLFLTARDQVRLNTLRQELEASDGIRVWVRPLDLALPTAVQELYDSAAALEHPVSLLINNAGFGWYGDFSNMSFQQIQDMLQVHIQVTTLCTRLFLGDMIKRREGTIINVASIAGFIPIPYMSLYAATKSYIIALSEGVAREVAGKGVRIQVCCPGYTETAFHDRAGHRPYHIISGESAQAVVSQSLAALQSSKIRVTIGWSGRVARWFLHWFPRNRLIALIAKFVKKNLN